MIDKSNTTYNLKNLSKDEFVTVLYNTYGKKLYAYAINTWHVGEDESWDLIYKTIYKVMDSYKNYVFDGEEKFASFIFKIFINYLRNHYRDNQKNIEVLPDTDLLNSNYGNREAQETEAIPESQKLMLLNEELDKMEDWHRMLLLMRSAGKSYAEIAKYIDKPEEQLKVYYQRFKEKLSKKLYERL